MGKCPWNECKSGVIKAYWLDFHKPIYIAFKLLNTLPVYNKISLMSSFILAFVKICMEMLHFPPKFYSQNVGTWWLQFAFLHFFFMDHVQKKL